MVVLEERRCPHPRLVVPSHFTNSMCIATAMQARLTYGLNLSPILLSFQQKPTIPECFWRPPAAVAWEGSGEGALSKILGRRRRRYVQVQTMSSRQVMREEKEKIADWGGEGGGGRNQNSGGGKVWSRRSKMREVLCLELATK
jgi:hypothetical protein